MGVGLGWERLRVGGAWRVGGSVEGGARGGSLEGGGSERGGWGGGGSVEGGVGGGSWLLFSPLGRSR